MFLTTAKSTAKISRYDCRELALLCMEAIYSALDRLDYN